MERAQCCIVTREEHARLGKVPKKYQGWDRYRYAVPPIRVRNMQTSVEVV